MRYQQEPLGEPLEMPEEVPREAFQSEYRIPPVRGSNGLGSGENYELPRPPDLTDQILDNNYQVRTSGDLTWLVVNDVPGRVWPALSAFFTEQGVEIVHEDPRQGLKQTGILNNSQRARRWIGLDDSAVQEELILQARVEHGVQGRSTEVQVRLVPVDGPPQSLLSWQDSPGDSARETTVIERMAEYLRENADTKSYSRVALDLPREERVEAISQESRITHLELDFGFERGWAEVSRALTSLDIPVVDRNRSDGVWYLDMRPEGVRNRGWWFWAYQLEPEQTGLIRLRESGSSLVLTVEPDPEQDKNVPASEVLDRIYDNLR
jgi:outer membrane protein assembly factor BamC